MSNFYCDVILKGLLEMSNGKVDVILARVLSASNRGPLRT
jgi:hypothetical protein